MRRSYFSRERGSGREEAEAEAPRHIDPFTRHNQVGPPRGAHDDVIGQTRTLSAQEPDATATRHRAVLRELRRRYREKRGA